MKKRILILSVIACTVLLGAAIGYRIMEKNRRDTEKQKSGVKPVAVDAVMPKREEVRDIRTFTGTLKAWSEFEVAPKVGGRLEFIGFDLGDRIPGGSVIARIDPVEYSQLAEQARADLEVARAQLQEARVVAELRRNEYLRQKNLIDKKASSRAQYESADSALRAQEASLIRYEAEVKRRQSQLDNAQLKLDDCTVSAKWPESAFRYVGARKVDSGCLLAANAPILTVAELDRLLAVVYVIERDYPKLRLHQTATVFTDAYPNEKFEGKVVRISQVLEDNTRQGAVQIEIPNRDLRLKPGMFVRVHLEFDHHPDAVTVPRMTLLKRDGKMGVFRIDPALKQAFFTPVTLGITAGDRQEILSPKLNFPIVTLGNHLLTNSAPVIVPEAFRKEEAETR